MNALENQLQNNNYLLFSSKALKKKKQGNSGYARTNHKGKLPINAGNSLDILSLRSDHCHLFDMPDSQQSKLNQRSIKNQDSQLQKHKVHTQSLQINPHNHLFNSGIIENVACTEKNLLNNINQSQTYQNLEFDFNIPQICKHSCCSPQLAQDESSDYSDDDGFHIQSSAFKLKRKVNSFNQFLDISENGCKRRRTESPFQYRVEEEKLDLSTTSIKEIQKENSHLFNQTYNQFYNSRLDLHQQPFDFAYHKQILEQENQIKMKQEEDEDEYKQRRREGLGRIYSEIENKLNLSQQQERRQDQQEDNEIQTVLNIEQYELQKSAKENLNGNQQEKEQEGQIQLKDNKNLHNNMFQNKISNISEFIENKNILTNQEIKNEEKVKEIQKEIHEKDNGLLISDQNHIYEVKLKPFEILLSESLILQNNTKKLRNNEEQLRSSFNKQQEKIKYLTHQLQIKETALFISERRGKELEDQIQTLKRCNESNIRSVQKKTKNEYIELKQKKEIQNEEIIQTKNQITRNEANQEDYNFILEDLSSNIKDQQKIIQPNKTNNESEYENYKLEFKND